MTDGDLRPCPFCGAGNVEMYDRRMSTWWVHCYRCGTEGPIGRDVETAKRMWNNGVHPRNVCWYCGGMLIWDSDADLEEGAGIRTSLHCEDCGAEVEYMKKEEEI